MNFKKVVIIFVAFAAALPLGAQMGGFGSQIPTLAGIWHPVVGNGATYEISRQGGKESTVEIAVLGKEDMEGKTGSWVEYTMTSANEPGPVTIKILETVEGNTINYTKYVMQMPGRPPMEMDSATMGMMGGRRNTQQATADFRDKAELVGSESVTVPAGTFTCEHYRMKDGSGDAWISDKVVPWGLVKTQDNNVRSMTLVKTTTDAKDRITGTPVKFDPSQMMRNRQGQGQ